MTRSNDKFDCLETPDRSLTLAETCAVAVSKVSQALSILANKRETLEAKMIKHYLSDLASICSLVISKGYQSEYLNRIDINFQREFQTTVAETTAQVEKLIDVAKYNSNFLEQYFEHDFATSLIHTLQLPERSGRMQRLLEDDQRVWEAR